MLKNISIGRKLFSAFFVLTIISIFIGYSGGRNIQQNNEIFKEIILGTTPRIQALLEMKNVSNEIGHNVVFIQTSDIEEVVAEEISASDSKSLILSNLERLLHWTDQYRRSADSDSNNTHEAFLISVTDSKSSIIATTLDYIDAQELGADASVIALKKNALTAQIDALRELISTAIVTETEGLRIQKEYATQGMKNVLITNILMSSLSVCLAILAWMQLSRAIVRPIRSLRNAAHAVASGNTEYVIDINSKDEVGELATAFRNMTQKLQESHGILMASNNKLESAQAELEEKLKETEKMNQHMIDREIKMVELKAENASLKGLIRKESST